MSASVPTNNSDSYNSSAAEYLAYNKAKRATTLSTSEVKEKRAAQQKRIALKAQLYSIVNLVSTVGNWGRHGGGACWKC